MRDRDRHPDDAMSLRFPERTRRIAAIPARLYTLLLPCAELLSFSPALRRLVRRLSHAALPLHRRLWTVPKAGVAQGLRLSLSPRFELDFWRGRYEVGIGERLHEVLGPGRVFYDVGAHIGFWSLVAARFVGSSGLVCAFEADAENAARLRTHVVANTFSDRVLVVASAVWDRSGQVMFHADGAASSRRTGHVAAEPVQGATRAIPCVSLDDFARAHRAPDVIKIDVEGAEIEVLTGARGIISAAHPIVICEMHSEIAARWVRRFLEEHGYRLEWLTSQTAFPQLVMAR
jgi:FkbM family methyltransferase